MNRYKKEQIAKHDAARVGLSKFQVSKIDKKDLIKKMVGNLAHDLHTDKFSEEYDFMYDSCADASDRRRGINPMNQEYIEKIRLKREALGVSQLSAAGNSVSGDTYQLCLKEAEKLTYSRTDIERPFSESCIHCGKALDEISPCENEQSNFGVGIFNGSDKDKIEEKNGMTTKLYSDLDAYVYIWGDKSICTEQLLDKAKRAFLSAKQPWLCPECMGG